MSSTRDVTPWLTLEGGRLDRRAVVLNEGDLREALLRCWIPSSATLLGHAFDGVVWGQISNGIVETSADHGQFGAVLERDTLLDLRVFEDSTELRVWRRDDGLHACLVQETSGGENDAGHLDYAAAGDRDYALIGAKSRDDSHAFTERVGRAGERHAPPSNARFLRVRHYFVTEPDSGLLREAAHRYICCEARY